MNKVYVLLVLFMVFAAACPGGGPITPTDHPGGDHEPHSFCIDFERANNESAVNGANAALLYRELGVTFPSNPEITNNAALCGGGVVPGPIRNQCLIQGDPDAARPERSCGPLEIRIDPGLEAGEVEFEARNVGFISIPVEIVATAYGERDGVEVQVDEIRRVSRSTLGDLEPVEIIKLTSESSEPPITRVVVDYRTCPPHVVINDLCIEPKEREVGTIGQSESGADRLVYYFDNRNRQSYVQLANLSESVVEVHVQVWIVNSSIHECEEIDFYDTYTPKDVNTYDVLNFERNSGEPLGITVDYLDGKYGFVVISKSEGPSNALVGSMRIIDNTGYEYKTNAVAPESVNTDTEKFGAINFNNANGNSFSELIGFTYTVIEEDTVHASTGIHTLFGTPIEPILLFDESENDISCSPKIFSCGIGFANVGIDLSLPNPHNPIPIVCPTRIIRATNSAGWMQLPFGNTTCTDPAVSDGEGNCTYKTHFVGFIGLNNGTSSGVFDSWWGGETSDDE